MKCTKQLNNKLEKSANFIQFDWVEFMSKEYFGVVEAINECYKKMLEIGKCKEVFRRVDGNQCELLTAKSMKDFLNSLTAIDGHDRQYFNKLRSTVVSRQIFIRLQSLIAH